MRPNLLGGRPPSPRGGATIGQTAPTAQPTATAGPQARPPESNPTNSTSFKLAPLLILAGVGYYLVKQKKAPTGDEMLIDMQRKQLAQGERSPVGWWAVGYGTETDLAQRSRWKTRTGPFASRAEADVEAKKLDAIGFYSTVAWGGGETGDTAPASESAASTTRNSSRRDSRVDSSVASTKPRTTRVASTRSPSTRRTGE